MTINGYVVDQIGFPSTKAAPDNANGLTFRVCGWEAVVVVEGLRSTF